MVQPKVVQILQVEQWLTTSADDCILCTQLLQILTISKREQHCSVIQIYSFFVLTKQILGFFQLNAIKADVVGTSIDFASQQDYRRNNICNLDSHLLRQFLSVLNNLHSKPKNRVVALDISKTAPE